MENMQSRPQVSRRPVPDVLEGEPPRNSPHVARLKLAAGAPMLSEEERCGSPARPDVPEIITLLLSFGADPTQRGISDYTALHMAVAERNLQAVDLLLTAGADRREKTRIDACESPLEMARTAGFTEIVDRLSAVQTKGRD